MPDEPVNDEQQPEPTPHFDEFSGHTKPNPTFTPNQSEPVKITTTPVQNGPMTSFTPNPVLNSEQARVPEGINMAQQSIVPTVSAGKPKWFKRKKFIIGIIAAVLVLLIGGGSAYAYVSYYQNPQKVISDSIINAITAKTAIYTGTINVDVSNTKVGIVITSKTADATGSLDARLTVTTDGKTYSVNGSGLVDKAGDLYFKVGNLAGIVAQQKTSMGIPQNSSISKAVDKLVSKIDGTWIKISSKDLKQYSADTATSKTCINDTVNKFKDDKTAINEVTGLYVKNSFIVVDKNLGQVGGSFGYQIKGSNAKLKAFLDELKNTKIYKSLHDCDKTFVIDTKGMSTKDETNNNNTFQLWVDVWSHQITKLELKSKKDPNNPTVSASILPKYNQSVTITAPTSYITLTQLQSYIQDLLMK